MTRNHLRTLRALAATPAPISGIDLVERLVGQVRSSSVYLALHLLERDNLAVSRWDNSLTRPLRLYTITESGVRTLQEHEGSDHGNAQPLLQQIGTDTADSSEHG